MFGSLHLLEGFSLVVPLTGLCAVPPVLLMAEHAAKTGIAQEALRLRRMKSVASEWTRYLRVWLRSSAIGSVIGILPGSGVVAVILGGLLATRIFGQVLRLPPLLLAPLILLMSVVGVYGINASVFDLWVMLGVGLLGYAMDRLDFPTAPAVLGMLLGPMAENELRLALTISMGDASVLFGSVASWMTIACTVLVFISPWLRRAWAARRAA